MALGWNNSRSKKLFFSYGKDWLLVIILIAAFFAIDRVEPFHREFSLENKDIMYPYAVHERVSTPMLVVFSFVVPAVFIIIISLAIRRSTYDLHNGILGLLLSLALTVMVTDVVKIAAGRPRPDFLDRCMPMAGSVDPPLGLSDSTICTQKDAAILRDGFKSFFSGHSSFSFAGLGYLSFYLGGKMKLFDQLGHVWKGFIFSLPLVGATLVAISRTMDYRHHYHDVIVGGLVGLFFAFFSYRQYYPPMHHEHPGIPHPVRIPLMRTTSVDSNLARQALVVNFSSDNGADVGSTSRGYSLDQTTPYRNGNDAELSNVAIDRSSGDYRTREQLNRGLAYPS